MRWGVVARDTATGTALVEHGGDEVLDTASVGKLILLAFIGCELLEDPASGATRLDRRAAAPVELMRSIGEAITGEQADTPPLRQEIRRR